MLKQYGCTATCYLVSGAIGGYNTWDAGFLQERKQRMSHAQVREWLAAGMEIGSHSCSHPRLPELQREALEREVAGSREALQKAFDVPLEHFCYPSVSHDGHGRAGEGRGISIRREHGARSGLSRGSPAPFAADTRERRPRLVAAFAQSRRSVRISRVLVPADAAPDDGVMLVARYALRA